jgi:ring-1,2-phenylacetyl-CoA epoxidase subunit PaaB
MAGDHAMHGAVKPVAAAPCLSAGDHATLSATPPGAENCAPTAGAIAAQAAHAESASGLRPHPADPWPLWEVFVRSKQGLEHKHCGSLHAADAPQALQMARDVYTRRQEGVSIWVVPSAAITASESEHKDAFFDPMADKVYRHPSFYQLPKAVEHM